MSNGAQAEFVNGDPKHERRMIVATELLAEPNLFTPHAFGGTTLCRKVNPGGIVGNSAACYRQTLPNQELVAVFWPSVDWR